MNEAVAQAIMENELEHPGTLGGAVAGNAEDKKRLDQVVANAVAKTKNNVRVSSQPNPCAALACGGPDSKYRGGAHSCMKLPLGDDLDSHHMPADSKSPLLREFGPAIQMEPLDHAKTASYKGRVNSQYYEPQRILLEQGQTMAAIMLDIADVKKISALAGDPKKYDKAIMQMLLYAQCLKKHGLIS